MSDYHIFLKYNARDLSYDGPIYFMDIAEKSGFGTEEIELLFCYAKDIATRNHLDSVGMRYSSVEPSERPDIGDRLDCFEFQSDSLDDVLCFKQEVLEAKVRDQPLADSVVVRDYKGLGEDYIEF
jgi:hypothetical protein